MEIDGRPTAPAEVRLLRGGAPGRTAEARVRIVIREGRNRQVRRMFDAIGHPVRRLRRTRLGPLGLRGLRPGAARELTPGRGRRAAPRGAVGGAPGTPSQQGRA